MKNINHLNWTFGNPAKLKICLFFLRKLSVVVLNTSNSDSIFYYLLIITIKFNTLINYFSLDLHMMHLNMLNDVHVLKNHFLTLINKSLNIIFINTILASLFYYSKFSLNNLFCLVFKSSISYNNYSQYAT